MDIKREYFTSEKGYLRHKSASEDRKKQIVGYRDDNGFYKYHREVYKYIGITIGFLGFVVSHIDPLIGFITFGIALLVYSSGPSRQSRRVYRCDTIKWDRAYDCLEYEDNVCPQCKTEARTEDRLVTQCPKCGLLLCEFGATLKVAMDQKEKWQNLKT